MNEGSSVHVYICNEKNIIKILNSIKNYKKVMIEEYIGGREIQVAIMGNKKLGAIELKPKENFMIIRQNIIQMLRPNIFYL